MSFVDQSGNRWTRLKSQSCPANKATPFTFYRNLLSPKRNRATGWTVRASNSGGDEIFRTCPDRPLGPTSFLYNGYRVFPGGKERPGRDADP